MENEWQYACQVHLQLKNILSKMYKAIFVTVACDLFMYIMHTFICYKYVISILRMYSDVP